MGYKGNVGDHWYISVMGDAAEVINPYSDVPVYQQLAGILRQQIESGELQHLDMLPSEKTLGQTYNVGRALCVRIR